LRGACWGFERGGGLMAAGVARSFRLPVGLDERLVGVAGREGRSLTAVVVEALSRGLGVPEGLSGPLGDRRVDLAQVAAEVSGLPRSVCLAKIRGGALTVDGVVWVDELARWDRLAGCSIAFDGCALEVGGAGSGEGPCHP
jgi:hypothetical protein